MVLLPDFPVPDLRNGAGEAGPPVLRDHRLGQAPGQRPKGDLDVMIIALRAPADGPIGDSGIVISDGTTTVFNMNDSRRPWTCWPPSSGHIDVHMLQYSGAIWYPMVHDMPARAKVVRRPEAPAREMDRCRQYIADAGRDVGDSVGRGRLASWIPNCAASTTTTAIPPTSFPTRWSSWSRCAHGHEGGLLMIPGSVADFTGSQLNSLTHPMPVDEVEAIFTTGKADYIAAYAQRMAPVLAGGEGRAGRRPPASRCWSHCALFEPIMVQSDRSATASAIPSSCGWVRRLSLDFPKRAVREPVPDEKFRYGFEIAPELVRTVLRDEEPDWVNTIFLSTRSARGGSAATTNICTPSSRLTDERIAYADGWFAETHDDTATITLTAGDSASLPAFRRPTCRSSAWWRTHADLQSARLAMGFMTGRCLTAQGHQLRCSGHERTAAAVP